MRPCALRMTAFLLALLGATARADDLQTAHYDLHVEDIDATETGAMLEELHATLSGYFGRAPEGRLPLAVYSTRERWHDALRADGQITPEAGGYYAPDTRKAYLFVQPSAYFTRQLILHEATHQFHYLAATGNKTPGADWYTEGLAEYFGMHRWDGSKLETGVVPAITLEDYPAKALEHFDALKCNLEGMIAGTVKADRPEAWALVHFLQHTRSDKFRRLARELDPGKPPLQAWRRAFGSVPSRLVAEFRAWLLKHQQPWRIAWIEWQERGGVLEGRSETSALAVLKSAADRLEVGMDDPGPETKAGIVFGFQSTDEFHVVQLMAGDRGRVVRRSAGKWEILATTDIPPTDGPNGIAIRIKDKTARAEINGKDLGAYEAPGQLGLDVESGRMEFRVAE
ncbi:MAG: DUF1570 domain-containing protein [Planctomycetes bacterium]|nr:DUF1570 domain-containing protein [Planctomycetota bacterium]